MTAGPAPARAASVDAAVAYLRTPEAIRDRAEALLARALDGGLAHFRVDLERLAPAADLVAAVTRERYPTGPVPLHSRWRHFSAVGHDRVAELDRAFAQRAADDRARAAIDLAVVSVLLDAGAGSAWRYVEAETGRACARSEGLAVASFRLVAAGFFAADSSARWRVDAAALERVDDHRLAAALQVSAGNPMPGVAGRAALLRRLGAALRSAPELFGRAEPRPGHLLDALRSRAGPTGIDAAELLGAILTGLGPIWPPRPALAGTGLEQAGLGDVWRHPRAGGAGPAAGLVPLHKLSQWLAYSLVEPLTAAGLSVTGLDRLTGLAEYRNGGLFVDVGVLVPRHEAVSAERHAPGDEIVVEWRALTVALLDRLAPAVRERLGATPAELPLGAVLEGGTWAAGRRLADERRGGAPPIAVDSDGTVM